jgi:multiple antibiotic resistance protein
MNPTELLAYFFGALVSLLTIVNPPIAVPLFIALSSRLTPAERNLQILRISTNVALILLCVLIFGGLLLQIFGISLGAIRVAGGLIIAFLGFRMLFPTPAHDHDATAKELHPDSQDGDFSFVPLAMPTLAGPGSMASYSVFRPSSKSANSWSTVSPATSVRVWLF